jgi:ATP-dependent Clp protease ATP-binding subunit ClpX
MTTDDLSPVYAADLRAITSRYLKPGSPVSDIPPPGGSFSDRISGYYKHLSPSSISLEGPGAFTEARARAYFESAAGDRLFTIEPMLRLASLELEREVRISIEERMLRVIIDRYDWLPFPFELIRVLQITVDGVPDHPLISYLDSAWHAISTSSMVGDALRHRPELRIECLRMGASNALTEFQVGVAELVTDLLLLVRAVREDLSLSLASAGDHGGSMSLALRHRDALVTEKVLPMLMTHPVRRIDVELDEFTSLQTFVASRRPLWQNGLLLSSREPVPIAVVRTTAQDFEAKGAATAAESSPSHAETGQDAYQRLLDRLKTRIIGAPEVCQRLALIGLAHERGVTHQRILICGPTGSGKTHAAKALAEALGRDRSHMYIDMNDITGTGWRGAELNSLVDALVSRKDGAHGILQLDEIDKIRLGNAAGLHGANGNSVEAKMNVQTALLALIDGHPITPEGGANDQLETSGLLIIGTGAFDGRFVDRPPTTSDLVRYGWIPELAARWGERICMPAPDLEQAMALLRDGERSVQNRLGPVLAAVGLEVHVSEAALAYAAGAWLNGGGDSRSAAELLLATARGRIIDALESGRTEPIVIAPDDVRLPWSWSGRDMRSP